MFGTDLEARVGEGTLMKAMGFLVSGFDHVLRGGSWVVISRVTIVTTYIGDLYNSTYSYP